MQIHVPTLSKAGWSKGIAERVDYLLSDFFTSEYSQSYLFQGSISSLTYLIQRYQGNVSSLTEATRVMLQSYFNSYFESVLIDVTSDAGTVDNESNLVSLSIYCQITENGKQYSVARLVQSIDSKLQKIVDLNNYPQSTL